MGKYDLARYTEAHRRCFETALSEIKAGRKKSHWMWFIFPQIKGLGKTSTSVYYSIEGLEEARAFLEDEYLGKNLREISAALLELKTDNATEVFGRPDDMKLKSSMTLFACASDENKVFEAVLDKYFGGRADYRTLEILGL